MNSLLSQDKFTDQIVDVTTCEILKKFAYKINEIYRDKEYVFHVEIMRR